MYEAISPQAFLNLMHEIIAAHSRDIEALHVHADELLCATLEALNYDEGVALYRAQVKWYA